jgi:NADH-quinone oxidoreductase subunit F
MDWRTIRRSCCLTRRTFHKLDVYEKEGQGYQALRTVLTEEKWSRKAVVDEVKKANIRGRGGAGFNAGLKWSFMPPKQEGVPRYLAVNGDESEPGTCKDRRLFEYNPHTIIEGATHRLLRHGDGCCLHLHPG